MRTKPTSDFNRPAVFMVNGLGDQLIALPAMRALSEIFPRGMQLLLGEGMLSFFYCGLPVGKTVRLWWDNHENDSIDVARVARSAECCDLFLCLTGHALPFAVELAHRMGASWTVGFSDIFDDQVPLNDDVHMFDTQFAFPQ
jgi:hypothetical protein